MISRNGPEGQNTSESERKSDQTGSEEEAERRKIRRLQWMVDMALSILSQDPALTLMEASEMVANCKSAALAMFPDKELAFDLIYKPRFQRVLVERFRLQ